MLAAPNKQRFDLSNLQEADINAGRGRLSFPRKTSDLTFDPRKLMIGIIVSDHNENDPGKIKAYYAHESGDKMTGKTTFEMTLNDGVLLLKKCAAELKIPESEIGRMLDNYSTGMSLFGQAFEQHRNDAAYALSELLKR